jgi:large subunit ribosomal protein L30
MAANKTAASKPSDKKIRVTLVKSVIGTRPAHRATVRGLGLRRLNSSVELADTPQVRGMISRINYLLKCEE